MNGKIADSSDAWYYKTPIDCDGNLMEPFVDSDLFYKGTDKSGATQTAYSKDYESLEELADYCDDNISANGSYYYSKQNFASSLRWINVEVYRVDPLTRENISKDGSRLSSGKEVEPVYSKSFGCNGGYTNPFYLKDFGISYKAGEMYRIVFNIDEYCKFGNIKGDFENQLPVASATSSIMFLCTSQDEQKTDDESSIFRSNDYTPLQWVTPPLPGKEAKIEIVNGSADRRDYMKRRIFDVYYQWFAVDPQTGEETQFAGITGKNEQEILDDMELKTVENYEFHKLRLDEATNSDGVSIRNDFLNTVNPDDKNTYDSNGLPHSPEKWNCGMVHAYTDRTISDLEDNKALSKNNYLYSASDTCYIPEEYKGYDIYVKAIVINNFWPKNFDHKQTFTSHKSLTEVTDDKLTFDVTKATITTTTKPVTTTTTTTSNVTTTTTTTPVTTTETIVLGDVDGNNSVDASDASAVLAAYAAAQTGNVSQLSEEQINAADVDGNGCVDASDASTILSYYAYCQTGGDKSFVDFIKS